MNKSNLFIFSVLFVSNQLKKRYEGLNSIKKNGPSDLVVSDNLTVTVPSSPVGPKSPVSPEASDLV
jgi:hypothetical protein